MAWKVLVEAEKSIAYFPGWSKPEDDDGYSWFEAPLAIDGVTEGGRVSDTHFHAFDINWDDDAGKMRGAKLPCAREIPEPLQSFEALREYVGKHFRINNIDDVPPPEWEYKLL